MSETKKSERGGIEKWKAVAHMLGLRGKIFLGGVENCEFSLEKLSSILDFGFIERGFKYNYSPTVETYYEFGKRAVLSGASVEYFGILENEYRDDAMLIIEGVKVTDFINSASLILDFAQTFHSADEFTANSELLRAWYD